MAGFQIIRQGILLKMKNRVFILRAHFPYVNVVGRNVCTQHCVTTCAAKMVVFVFLSGKILKGGWNALSTADLNCPEFDVPAII